MAEWFSLWWLDDAVVAGNIMADQRNTKSIQNRAWICPSNSHYDLPLLGRAPSTKVYTEQCPLLEKKHLKHEHKQFKTVILGGPIWVGIKEASLKQV